MTDTNTDTQKRKNVTFKDLFMAFMINESVEEISRLHDESNITRETHRKAIKQIKEANKDTTAYEAWLSEVFPGEVGGDSRGKTPPQAGESRVYKVQRVAKKKKDESGQLVQVGMSGPFIRLPLDSLSLDRGDKIRVSFDNGVITVAPADSTDEVSNEDEEVDSAA